MLGERRPSCAGIRLQNGSVRAARGLRAALGHEIPFWEVDRALGMLIDVLDDPSPRVREYAMVGLWELGERAGKACPRLIKLLSDDDRYVRSAAARCLGKISANADDRLSVVMALDSALVDKDADVRLAAADSLLELEETEKAAPVLIAAYFSTEPYFSGRARSMIRRVRKPEPLVPLLVKELQSKESRRRELALEALLQIGSPDTARSALNSLQADDEPEIRRWAAARLEQIHPG